MPGPRGITALAGFNRSREAKRNFIPTIAFIKSLCENIGHTPIT